jgi:hypothetical protein
MASGARWTWIFWSWLRAAFVVDGRVEKLELGFVHWAVFVKFSARRVEKALPVLGN